MTNDGMKGLSNSSRRIQLIASFVVAAVLLNILFPVLARAVSCEGSVVGTNCVVSFTSSTDWTAPGGVNSVTYLVVGGGGGGGGVLGGGGGGGGVRTGTLSVVPGNTYTVTVGAGGAIWTIGGDSTFSTITSLGGGRGGRNGAGSAGGSGGGGSNGGAAGAGTAGQGNNGGIGVSAPSGAGGGGGAGAVGSNAGSGTAVVGGAGGAGVASSITGSSVVYGGGGGGGGRNDAGGTTAGGAGGSGGGGTGGNSTNSVPPTAGTAGRGGGGGGGGFNGVGIESGAAGGSGIVIISYAIPFYHTSITLTKNSVVTGGAAVLGALSKGSGSFVIDHPLNPKNWLLYHSFVESPDVKNIYDGIATLGESGEAVIELPGYFLALNKDFRYLGTAIGQPMPNLYLSGEVRKRFFGLFGTPVIKLSGGAPNGKVSWQVTGIRHDPFILANPIIPEVDKGPGEAADKGEYICEECYSQ